jgi:hypothetical protein
MAQYELIYRGNSPTHLLKEDEGQLYLLERDGRWSEVGLWLQLDPSPIPYTTEPVDVELATVFAASLGLAL